MKRVSTCLSIGTLLVLLGCSSATPSQAPTPLAIRECGFKTRVSAWIDQNGDGIHDGKEQPLLGVTFFLDDVHNGYKQRAKAVTTSAGTGSLAVFLPGCPEARFEAYAETPDGYRATTPIRKPVIFDSLFEVGFAMEP